MSAWVSVSSRSRLENPGDQIVHRERIKLEQAAFVERIRRTAPQARFVGEVQIVLNALLVEADATALRSLATDASVIRISRVADYQADLSETVPYITAKKLQKAGKLTGKGVKVAVLDSGIDYTHVAFGGAGTLEAYEAAHGTSDDDARNTTRDGLFPTHRVVEGHDFVGEAWPNGPLAPDDDPIDSTSGPRTGGPRHACRRHHRRRHRRGAKGESLRRQGL